MLYLLKVWVLVLISVSVTGLGTLLLCYACLAVGMLVSRLNHAMAANGWRPLIDRTGTRSSTRLFNALGGPFAP
jgi:hypothetical protein